MTFSTPSAESSTPPQVSLDRVWRNVGCLNQHNSQSFRVGTNNTLTIHCQGEGIRHKWNTQCSHDHFQFYFCFHPPPEAVATPVLASFHRHQKFGISLWPTPRFRLAQKQPSESDWFGEATTGGTRAAPASLESSSLTFHVTCTGGVAHNQMILSIRSSFLWIWVGGSDAVRHT